MARLTRDFSGKQGGHEGYSGAQRANAGRPLAYHHPVMERRAAGERIGLLLVSIDDWHGGEYFVERPNVARVAALEDHDLATVDWSVVAGLDCLVCGDADQARFDLAVLMCLRAGAASVWGEFDSGMVRVEFWRHAAPYYVPASRPVPADRFGSALAAFRDTALLLEDGFYGLTAFAPMRAALLARIGL